jgi:ketosteroid isomerase-like protein
MKNLIFGALLAAVCATAGPASGGEAADALAVLQTQVAAWNRGDLAVFCDGYADDATFLSPSGIARGRRPVLERYRKRYPDKAAMGTLTIDPLETRPAPSRDSGSLLSVSIAARWTLSYPDKPAATGLTLLVLHRIGARWQIVQDSSF